MSKIVMTSLELVEKLVTLANDKSKYNNKYPYNVLRFNEDGSWSADCLNLLKALFNGRDIKDKTVGSYCHDLSNTTDCTESGLISQCTDVSTDFKKLSKNVPEVLYMNGHVGCYLGKELTVKNHIVNVVECTVAFGGGIVYSYVDNNGNRFDYKGGNKCLAWTKHGKATKWINYVKVEEESKTLKDGDIIKLTDDAKYDNGVSIPSWVKQKTLYYRGLADNKVNYKFSTQKTGAITGVVEPKYVVGQTVKVMATDYTKVVEKCPYDEPTETLRKNCYGNGVRWVQWYLVKTGFMSDKLPNGTNSIDGYWGNCTDESFTKFQNYYPTTGTYNRWTNRWDIDHVCGKASRDKLKELYK